MRKPSLKGLKSRAWDLCSMFVRLRDSDAYGYGRCITCSPDVPLRHYKEVDAGHYIHGKIKPTGYLEENVNFQCTTCNYFKRVQANAAYDKFMIAKYGSVFTDELKWRSKQFEKQGKQFYVDLIDYYKKKVTDLLKSKDERVVADVKKRFKL